MIDRLLYVATAAALLIVLMFDQNFTESLSRAFGEPTATTPLIWEVSIAGILAALIVAAVVRERRRR